MKYFSIITVENAYKNISTRTNNKFWGILAITSSVGSLVTPQRVYSLDIDNVSNLLEKQFCLVEKPKNYTRGAQWNVIFSKNWAEYISEKLLRTSPNIYDVLVWYFRREIFEDTITKQQLVAKFLEETNISTEFAKKLFTFDDRDLEFADNKYSESLLLGILNKLCNNTTTYTTVTAEKSFVAANAGELSRAPFVQTLYAGQGAQECMILTQFDFNEYYGDVVNKKTSGLMPDNQSSATNDTYISLLTALRTKPFMLLAGISGTGKSRLVKELAFMTCLKDVEDPDEGIMINAQKDPTSPFNYCHVEVKPNWHDSSELLGYYNALDGIYELTPFIRFVYRAIRFPEMPFFVCLDEMNLAPVEQYFAEYLSALETRTLTKEGIVSAPLLEQSIFNGVDITKYKQPSDVFVVGYLKENGLKLPNNLYVVGTVNMDDTTHQFSRKVIDRAFTLEMNGGDLTEMFSQKNTDALKYRTDVVPLEALQSNFIHASEIFEDGSPYLKYEQTIKESVPSYLNAINNKLANTPFQVSYRVQNELILYLAYLIQQNNFPDDIEALIKEAVLAVLMEKILPRVQGDDKLLGRGKDKDVFTELTEYVEQNLIIKEHTEDDTEVVSGSELYRKVINKLDQMHKRLESSYFANFF